MEEEISSPYLSEEVDLTKSGPIFIYRQLLKITAWRRFAHHPTCSVYKNHYYTIGKLHLCVGCTSLYSSIILSLIMFFSFMNFFRSNPYYLAFTFVIGILGPFIHFAIRPKNKWIKTIFRVSAGIALSAYIGLIAIVPSWWLRIVMFIFIAAGFSLYGLMRGKNANLKYCKDCRLRSAEPPCFPHRNTNIRIEKINQFVAHNLEEKKARRRERKNLIE
ncbi:MAG: hypothetical protein GOP50_04560 [Candidatus Heimdallarchaeota archaeon]|nr:hypothetical protein [Candidatus Heimdallarchaeota archaeon]